jgi:hypothetical protein
MAMRQHQEIEYFTCTCTCTYLLIVWGSDLRIKKPISAMRC